MSRRISVIIPNRNGEKTIGRCLEAAFASAYEDFEVIVVDDASTDRSVEIIRDFPCTLVRLDRHAGASAARNEGARQSSGEILFFIDSDCLLQKDTLAAVATAVGGNTQTLFGGTYTPIAADDSFFSTFQSVLVNYSETKYADPDYIASHAMAMDAGIFRRSGGFPEEFMPIIEDVEYSHRLRRQGYTLRMDHSILVRHIFNFTLLKSLRNGFRKSLYWTVYSLANRDLHRDSGAASFELKAAVLSWCLNLMLFLGVLLSRNTSWLVLIPAFFVPALYVNRRLLSAFFRAKGFPFALVASFYLMMLYPSAVTAGGGIGMLRYLSGYKPSVKRDSLKGTAD